MVERSRLTESMDAAEAWKPWRPNVSDPWSRKWIAHTYRRAGFGPSPEEMAEAERLGFERTIDLLLGGQPNAESLRQTLTDIGQAAAERDDGGVQLRGWWLYCMLHSGHPLREKLTLFWHNHFATSIAKIQKSDLMFRQNSLLRRHALGKFGVLLHEISRDGAMLVWLDSNRNVAGKPNENYARELMELFSLGVGHYSERDIREAARALTGWHTDGRGFTFQARLHDNGIKTFLGQTGNWNGDDVVRIVLSQPAVAQFLVRKLYQFFVSESATPSDDFLRPLADAFRTSDYDVGAIVRTILSSRHFYSAHAFRQRVKSPVEYALGAVRAIYRPYDERDPNYRPLVQRALIHPIGAMGQTLFAPPNVKGWPGGKAWLNTATMLERDNFAAQLAQGTLWTGSTWPGQAPPLAYDPARLVHEVGAEKPEDAVRVLVDQFVAGGCRPEARDQLTAFVANGNRDPRSTDERLREAVHAILTMPEYQLA